MNKITKWKQFWRCTTGHPARIVTVMYDYSERFRETSRSVVLIGKFNFPHVLFVNEMVLRVIWLLVADFATVNIKWLSLKTGGMQKTVSRPTAMAFGRADFIFLRKLVRKSPLQSGFQGYWGPKCWSVLRAILWEWRSRSYVEKFKQVRQKFSLAGQEFSSGTWRKKNSAVFGRNFRLHRTTEML